MLKIIKKRITNFNPIDYVLFLLVLVVGIFLITKFLKKTEFVYVDLIGLKNSYSGEIEAPELWGVENIKKGDRIYNNYGNNTAVIDEVERYTWRNGRQADTNLTVKLLATFDNKQNVYLFGGSPMRIGGNLEIDLGNYKFTGIIRNVYKNKEDRFLGYRNAKAIVWVRMRGYEKEHLERLKNFIEKDSDGKEIVKVIEIKISPSELYVATNNGLDLYLGKGSTTLVDAVVKVELNDVKCKSDEICFYNGRQTFSIGSLFSADNGDTWFGPNNVVIDRKILYE